VREATSGIVVIGHCNERVSRSSRSWFFNISRVFDDGEISELTVLLTRWYVLQESWMASISLNDCIKVNFFEG
jgi:hypothetical protein